jgi:hypothetical protein
LSFIAALLLVISPLVLVSLRFAALGEIDLIDADGSLINERLHGPVSEVFPEYKLRMTEGLRPSLLVLGSSRVMQFRASFFDGCSIRSCFYNAGGAAPTMRAGQDFLKEADMGQPPRVMLLGLDIWQFNPNDSANTHEPTSLTPSFIERVRRAIGIVRQFTPRLADDTELRSAVLGQTVAPEGYRGVRAIVRGEGFRPDGSYSYGDRFMTEIASQSPVERSADAVDRIAKSCCRLERFTRADPVSIGELQVLLTEARQREIDVIAFTLPFSDEMMDAVERDVALRAGFADVESQLAAVFVQDGVAFLRFSRLADAGCRPTEMIDGFHASEVCAARILDRLLDADGVSRALAPFVDRTRLRARIASRSSDLFMPP